jgi:chromate transporter
VSWAEVIAVFARASFLGFSGSTLLALLEGDLVQRLHVLTPAQFATGVAIGAASPGPLGYGCIALGFMADGWRGAVIATLASWLPSFLAIPMAVVRQRLAGRGWLEGLNWGIAAAGAGLLLALAGKMAWSLIPHWPEAAIALAALGLLLARVPLPLVLALAAIVGAVTLR